jgi:hypothetical protein
MTSLEFLHLRKELGKTQKEMAELLGTSLKAVHSYEQGWRSIPAHAERQMLFLVSRRMDNFGKLRPCWQIKKCPPERKRKCPAWEFRAGKLCWFINGTICEGEVQANWREKMAICHNCDVFRRAFPPTSKGG